MLDTKSDIKTDISELKSQITISLLNSVLTQTRYINIFDKGSVKFVEIQCQDAGSVIGRHTYHVQVFTININKDNKK